MATKKNAKKAVKAAPKKTAKNPVKKKTAKKAVGKRSAKKQAPTAAPAQSSRGAQEGIPCICIKTRQGWFCMKREDDELVECDGPFTSRQECESHRCL